MQEDSNLKLLLYRLALLIPDRWYVMAKYYKNFGRLPNLRSPKTFNEKLQWLKLHNHRPEYTKMVDKYEAKKYVAEIIGDEYIIPTLGVWDRAEDIDLDSLPNQFVLKATHDSGRVVICKDKAKLDIEKAVDEMRISLGRNFYAVTREWPYKNVKPRIIAEQYMQDDDGQINESYSVSAGLDFPSIGPQHAYLKDTGRVNYISATDNQALEAFAQLSCAEGIIPALESSHALAGALELMRKNPNKEQTFLVNLSGRGDKDIFNVNKVLAQKGCITKHGNIDLSAIMSAPL